MKLRNCDKIVRKLLSFNIHIYLSGKRTRKNLNNNARNENEMKSLIPKEDVKTLTGGYPDSLLHRTFHNLAFLVRKKILKQTNKKQNPKKKPTCAWNIFSDKSSFEILYRSFKML